MKLSPSVLEKLAESAISAAKQAGDIIESYTEKTVTVQKKSGGDSYASQVVTEVDLLCDAAISKILRPLCAEYDLALLTEETEDDKLEKKNADTSSETKD